MQSPPKIVGLEGQIAQSLQLVRACAFPMETALSAPIISRHHRMPSQRRKNL